MRAARRAAGTLPRGQPRGRADGLAGFLVLREVFLPDLLDLNLVVVVVVVVLAVREEDLGATLSAENLGKMV